MTAVVALLGRALRYWWLWLVVGGGWAYRDYQEFLDNDLANATSSQQANGSEISRLRSKIENYKQQKPRIAEMQGQVKKLAADLDLLLNQLPRDFNIAQILKKMNELGKGSSLDFHTFKPSGEKVSAEGFYAEMPIEMKLQGSFPQILLFFDRLSKQQRIVNITNIRFKGQQDKGPYFVSEVIASGSTYRFVEGSSFASTSAPAPGTPATPGPSSAPNQPSPEGKRP